MRRGRILIFAAGAVCTSLLFINFCATIFRCGCASLWNDAAAHCNIHIANARHCPWCAYGTAASMVPYVLIVAAQAAVSFWPRTLPIAMRLVLAIAAFPIAGAAIAGIYGLASGYWR